MAKLIQLFISTFFYKHNLYKHANRDFSQKFNGVLNRNFRFFFSNLKKFQIRKTF